MTSNRKRFSAQQLRHWYENENHRCESTECSIGPSSVIHSGWMLPGPDYLECQVTLRVENLSSEYSYSDISITSAKVYRALDNQLLGEIRFETDWDGSLESGEAVTVEFVKIMEDSKLFDEPCDEYLYLHITIASPGYGEMNKGTPTDICSCLI